MAAPAAFSTRPLRSTSASSRGWPSSSASTWSARSRRRLSRCTAPWKPIRPAAKPSVTVPRDSRPSQGASAGAATGSDSSVASSVEMAAAASDAAAPRARVSRLRKAVAAAAGARHQAASGPAGPPVRWQAAGACGAPYQHSDRPPRLSHHRKQSAQHGRRAPDAQRQQLRPRGQRSLEGQAADGGGDRERPGRVPQDSGRRIAAAAHFRRCGADPGHGASMNPRQVRRRNLRAEGDLRERAHPRSVGCKTFVSAMRHLAAPDRAGAPPLHASRGPSLHRRKAAHARPIRGGHGRAEALVPADGQP